MWYKIYIYYLYDNVKKIRLMLFKMLRVVLNCRKTAYVHKYFFNKIWIICMWHKKNYFHLLYFISFQELKFILFILTRCRKIMSFYVITVLCSIILLLLIITGCIIMFGNLINFVLNKLLTKQWKFSTQENLIKYLNYDTYIFIHLFLK